MRVPAALIIVVVRKQEDVELALEAGAASGWRKVNAYVAGAAGAPTAISLKKIRHSTDVRKRRLPVLVWCAGADEENAWRNAGAYVTRGAITKIAALRALQGIAANREDWVESLGYVGPDRRKKNAWLGRSSRRLTDGETVSKTVKAMADNSSFATQMRQLRHSAFGVAETDRDRRAQFLADARRTAAAADRNFIHHGKQAMDSLIRYVSACGATGKVDEMLVERHLDIAEGSSVDAQGALSRLAADVDFAIGLTSAA